MAKKKEYFTIDEVAQELGIHRTSVYPYLNQLHIQRRKFKLGRHLYISAADFERIKEAKEQPWKAEEEKHDNNTQECT